MASLQDLPTELLIEILISCPTTRTLLRLSSINRRMRAVWLEHSKHIIVANYKQRISHIEQAIALTLTEVQCGEIPKSPEDHTLRRQIDPNRLLPTSPEFVPGCSSHESHSSLSALDPLQNQPSIGLYLPRVLRNAGIASSICDKLSKHWQEERNWDSGYGGVVCKGCLRLQTTTSKSAPKRCRPSTSRGGIRVLYVEDHSRLAAPEVTRDEPPPLPLDPIRLYLPRILHNARLASMVCDDFVNTLQTGRLYQRSWQPTEDPYTDSLRAYYMMRHIALAWDYPQLRPAVMSTPSESSYNMLQEYKHLYLSLERCPSREIHDAHATYERIPVAERDSDQDDEDERMTERWLAVECVLHDAEWHCRNGSEQVSDWDITKFGGEEAWFLRIFHGPAFAPVATLAPDRLEGSS